jgi:hypothetical protein
VQHPTWLTHANAFVCGALLALLEERCGDAGCLDTTARDALGKLLPEAAGLYAAELALLGGHVMLADSLRDIDSAQVARELGLLYLRALRTVLSARAAILEAKPTDATRRYDARLATLFQLAGTAAERFLEQALDIFADEPEHERCLHGVIGETAIAMGDLRVITAEAWLAALGDSAGEVLPTPEEALPGLTAPWPALRDLIESGHAGFGRIEVEDRRRRAAESYRLAVRNYLAEVENYTKRYRFPHEAYFLHGNIMDDQLHVRICQSIRQRLWNFLEPPVVPREAAMEALIAERQLQLWTTELSHNFFNRFVNVSQRRLWLHDLWMVMKAAGTMRTGSSYLRVVAIPTRGETLDHQKLVWCQLGERTAYTVAGSTPEAGSVSGPHEEWIRSFFRIWYDGLARCDTAPT